MHKTCEITIFAGFNIHNTLQSEERHSDFVETSAFCYPKLWLRTSRNQRFSTHAVASRR